jgi:sensor histidine kinase regulating citrate/malate metabolism
MVNSCRTNPFSKGKKILVTNKPDKLRHGYGLKSIEKIVERYGGDIKQYYDGETASFHTIITLKEVPEELY